MKHGWAKIPNWECLFVHREQGLFLSVYVDDIKLAGKKQSINPMWKVLNKEVDLGEPTSLFDHVYLGCTQRQCETSKDNVDNYRTMFESRISVGAVEKLPFSQNLRISSWSYDMAGHAKKCVERYCGLANKTTQQLYKVSTPCIDDHHFKEEEMKYVGELSHVCSQIVLKCLYLARIGRPDILWSVNKLARSITKWTKACDKRLNRLISYIHHACEYRQYCHVGNTAKQCRLGLFQDSDFAGDLEDSKSTSGGTSCIFGSHTFVPKSWMCKKQTAVSHSSTESEIISLDTGLRLDGLPALELWDLIVSVLGSVSQISDRTGRPVNVYVERNHKSQKKINVIENIDSVPSNVQPSHQEALLYVFEDNEAVIKMIIKGRSPTMRHVSRTHRVALDWLFDRINLDPMIQIKYIDTKNQLADSLTKGNFTRDEWNHLLCLFNISHFSSTVCSDTMAKRSQQDSGEERVTAKSRPMMNLTARTPSFESSSTSVSPGKKHYGSQDPWKSVAGEDRSGRLDKGTDLFEASDHYFNEQFMESFSSTNYSKLDDDRAWSSQEWKTVATTYDRSSRPDKTSCRMLRKVRPDQEEILLDGTAQFVRYGETLRDSSGRPDNINSQEVANSQNFIMGRDTTEIELSVESRSFVHQVNDQVRKRQKIISKVAEEEEQSMIWGMFMAVTMESAVFMGKNFQNNQNSIVNTADPTLKQIFYISAKLVAEQDEISSLETIGWKKHSWKYLSLIGDGRIINLQRTKVYVFSDSVLCLGKIHQNPESNEAWKKRIEWITSSQSYRDFDGINGEPTEFEWNIFPGFETLQLCGKVTDLLSRLRETPENFTRRILFMSIFNDISCDKKYNEECVANAKVVSILARKFGIGQWSFIGPGSERSGILWKRKAHKEFGITSRKRCWWNSQRADVQFSVLLHYCLEVNSKAKDMENCRYPLVPLKKQLRLFSRRYVKSMNPFNKERCDLL